MGTAVADGLQDMGGSVGSVWQASDQSGGGCRRRGLARPESVMDSMMKRGTVLWG